MMIAMNMAVFVTRPDGTVIEVNAGLRLFRRLAGTVGRGPIRDYVTALSGRSDTRPGSLAQVSKLLSGEQTLGAWIAPTNPLDLRSGPNVEGHLVLTPGEDLEERYLSALRDFYARALPELGQVTCVAFEVGGDFIKALLWASEPAVSGAEPRA